VLETPWNWLSGLLQEKRARKKKEEEEHSSRLSIMKTTKEKRTIDST